MLTILPPSPVWAAHRYQVGYQGKVSWFFWLWRFPNHHPATACDLRWLHGLHRPPLSTPCTSFLTGQQSQTYRTMR
jgi:hypothetical protein